MIHPDIELRFINDTIGYGVFAKKRIPEGTITYIKDSLEIEVAPEDFQRHPPVMQQAIDKYSYTDERGYRIVSWDIAKYVNHCCQSNTISTGWGFEFAIRDIEEGEQITDEYGIFNLDKEMQVFCGNSHCRKVIRPDDFDRLYPQWDASIQKSMKQFEQVPQPLLPLMDPQVRQELERYLTDSRQYKSVYSLRLHGQDLSQPYRNNGSR